ncbi:MAG: hypothetical protein EXX96DRAFT_137807 [Benjaminiella poitrasii]|nr:MAG: hypothetical protein EXX96DRAFT_137807 [Benjaminiella poitrasii]
MLASHSISQGKNSTCPSPLPTVVTSSDASIKSNASKISPNVTALYELFSSTATIRSKLNSIKRKHRIADDDDMTSVTAAESATHINMEIDTTASTIPKDAIALCFCCERELANVHNPGTDNAGSSSVLYFESNKVRQYMKSVMTLENWSAIIQHGFPCPHTALWEQHKTREHHYFCTKCNADKRQSTLRLTLTPSDFRAQDKEIYSKQHSSRNAKKRKRLFFLFVNNK